MVEVGSGAFRYRVAEGWEQLPAGWRHRDVAGVAVDSRDNVYVFNRDEHPVIVYDREGRHLGSWGEGLFSVPHGITIGPDDSVFCVDTGDHTVRKFTTEGRLLLTIGTAGSASDTGFVEDYRSIRQGGPPFNKPTNLALGPSGDLYVSDGYGNARVHCFSPDGGLRFSWGEPGSGAGQFKVPHAIATDPDGRVLVADRENCRIQVFSSRGDLLDIWTSVTRPDDLKAHPDGYVVVGELSLNAGRWPFMDFVADAAPSCCSVLDLSGRVQARWGGSDSCASGSFFAPHGVCVDSRGDLYVGEVVWAAGGSKGEVPADCHTLQKLVRLS